MKPKKAIAQIITVMPIVAWLVFMHYITVVKDLPTGQWACGMALSILVMLVAFGFLRIFFIDVGFID
ncbi:MAG: hypothetical protein UGF89_02125 [Acutalibacteraceae bacterium]|nr:hypothetical protein [Acutalibacteraceae bacterium]